MCVTALLIGLFVARPLINRMFASNAAGVAQPLAFLGASPVAGALAAPAAQPGVIATDASGQQVLLPAPQPGIDLSRIEGQVRESSVKKIGEVVNAHPEEALAIIRTWLHQPV
jgi:flagellar M-ring protein FliF